MVMVKATWGLDYDYRVDKCFNAPMHERCDAPIHRVRGKYICIACGQEAKVDESMKKWIDEREGEKIDVEGCIKCGKPKMTYHYHKNRFTLEWQLGWAECSECGCRLIV